VAGLAVVKNCYLPVLFHLYCQMREEEEAFFRVDKRSAIELCSLAVQYTIAYESLL
jgi:hypothetical protein